MNDLPAPRVVIHGSFGQHFDVIKQVQAFFTSAGFEVLAPKVSDIVAIKDDFLLLEDEETIDPRLVELQYLHNLQKLGPNGFSYFVNPGGYIGRSVAYELGIAQLTNTRCLFWDAPRDLPAYVPANTIWRPQQLVEYWQKYGRLPQARRRPNEQLIHQLQQQLMVPGSVVATGGIIEYRPDKSNRLPEVLLVKTHKWGNRYSMVGGRVRRNERLEQALVREIREETGLAARAGQHLCTFDQIKGSGYYKTGVHHMFVDYVVQVSSRQVRLNDEAQDYLWVPAEAALAELDIEPNARHTLQLYAGQVTG